MLVLNEDVLLHLIAFLDLRTISYFVRTCVYFHQTLACTALYKQIKEVNLLLRTKDMDCNRYPLKSDYILQHICKARLKIIFRYLLNSNYSLKQLAKIIYKVGDLSMLEWLNETSDLSFSKYVTVAAIHNNIAVLDRCFQMGYNMLNQPISKQTNDSYLFDLIAANGHVLVLEWYRSHGFRLDCSSNAVNWAAMNNHRAVLDWLNDHCSFLISNESIVYAAQNGHLKILDWLHLKTPHLFHYYRANNWNAIHLTDSILDNDHLAVFNWFAQKGYAHCLHCNKHTINHLIMHNKTGFLDWFKTNDSTFEISTEHILYAIECVQPAMLDWFKKNNYLTDSVYEYIHFAIKLKKLEILDWFQINQFSFEPLTNHFIYIINTHNTTVCDWFLRNRSSFNLSKVCDQLKLHLLKF